jgi:hypothetical protein
MTKYRHTPPWYASLVGDQIFDEEEHVWHGGTFGDLDLVGQVRTTRGVKVFPVITLCGSTRFKDAFISEQKRLTLEGNIVISVGTFGWDEGRPEDVFGQETKDMLDEIHKRKIDISDSIHVINVDGYVGSSTQSEISYAIAHDIPVTYMEPT